MTLALEVEDRVEDRRERTPGLAGEADGRAHGGESRRRDLSRREQSPARGAGTDDAGAEERRHGGLGASAEVAADDGVAGEGHDEHLRLRHQRRDAERVGGRSAQVLRAREDQRREARQHGGRGRRRRGVGPGGAVGDEAVGERGAGSNGEKRGGGHRVQSAERFGRARRRGRAALPWERQLLARSRDEQGFVDGRRLFGRARQVRDETLREQVQSQQRHGIAPQGRAHGCGEERAQRGVEVAGLEDFEHAGLGQARAPPVTQAVVGIPVQVVYADPRDQGREVCERIGGDVGGTRALRRARRARTRARG